MRWLSEVNFNPVPANISISTNINRLFNNQRFREVYLEGVDANNQLSLPNLQQRNFLFDWTYSLNHNLTRSLRMNFTASSNNIVKNYYEDTPDGEQRVDKARGIWDGLWDFGDPNRHFQSLNLTYKLPFNYLPYLSFIDANFSYTGDFSWQRGSDILAEVQNDLGDVLGIVNTVQNVNSKAINVSISTSSLYQILGLKNKRKGVQRLPQRQQPLDTAKAKKPKKKRKALIQVVNVLNTLKRLQFSYTENNGQVLPGYLPKVGLVGTHNPQCLHFWPSDVRYEAAKQSY